MPRHRSQFSPDRAPRPREGRFFVPLSDSQKRQRKLIALLFLICGMVGIGWIVLNLYELALNGIVFLAPIFVIVFALVTLASLTPQLWRLINEGPTRRGAEKEISPEEAADLLEAMPPGRAGISNNADPPAPPGGAPLPAPPRPMFADWVLATGLGMMGVIVTGMAVALFFNTLQKPRDQRNWTGYVTAMVVCGLLVAALFLAARFTLSLRKNEWLRLAAQRARICGRCGYDLRGVRGNCPECGEPIPPVESPEAIAARLDLFAGKKDLDADRRHSDS